MISYKFPALVTKKEIAPEKKGSLRDKVEFVIPCNLCDRSDGE